MFENREENESKDDLYCFIFYHIKFIQFKSFDVLIIFNRYAKVLRLYANEFNTNVHDL